jgi:hypothetical protein
MIIDLILNRKDGKDYNPKEFYNDIMKYYEIFPEIVEPIANALDNGTENQIKQALRDYIKNWNYSELISDYITSQKWL